MPVSTYAMCRSPPGTPTRRTTMRYDRARKNLDRHPNYIPRHLHGIGHLSRRGPPHDLCIAFEVYSIR